MQAKEYASFPNTNAAYSGFIRTTAPSKSCLAKFEVAGGWTTSAGTGLIIVFAYRHDEGAGEVACRELTEAEYAALFAPGALPVPLSVVDGLPWCEHSVAPCV